MQYKQKEFKSRYIWICGYATNGPLLLAKYTAFKAQQLQLASRQGKRKRGTDLNET